MTIDKLVYQLKKAAFPIRLYIIDHATHPVRVSLQGFINDQTLQKELSALSLSSKMGQFSKKSFYDKTIIVPVFEDSKFPVGSVTLKITAKINNKDRDGFHDPSHGGQRDSLSTDPLHSVSVRVVKHRAEYLPNVWFPPPLSFTSTTPVVDGSSTINKNDSRSRHATPRLLESSFPDDDNHWSAVVQCNDSSFPWKGDIFTRCDHNAIDKKVLSDQKLPTTNQPSNEVDLREYPYLSGLYRELTILHDNTALAGRKNQTIREIKNQFVQTDPLTDEEGKQGKSRSADTAIHHHDCDCVQPSVSSKHQQTTTTTTTLRMTEGSHNSTDIVSITPAPVFSSKQGDTDDRHADDQRQILREFDGTLSVAGISNNNIHVHVDNGKNDLEMSPTSSYSLSSFDVDTSRPIIPILTISQASTSDTSQTHIPQAPPSLPPQHATNILSSSNNIRPPSLLQVFQSTESAMTLTGTISNEVKCGNPCLEQKLYLASSMQSIDYDGSSGDSDISNDEDFDHSEEENSYNVMSEHSQSDTTTTSNSISISISCTEVSHLNELSQKIIEEELESESDYDHYSEDFESDNTVT